MAEAWFALSVRDQAEALEVAAGCSGRPAHLWERTSGVVRALGVIDGLANQGCAGKREHPGKTLVSTLSGRYDRVHPIQ